MESAPLSAHPRGPSLFSLYSLSPPPPTSLLLHRTHCLWVHESLHFILPNSQLTTNPTTASTPPTFSFYYHDNTQWGEQEGEEKSGGTRKRWTRGRERGTLTSASIFKKGDDHRSGGLPWPARAQNQQQTASQTNNIKEICFIMSNALQKGSDNVYFSSCNCSCWTVNRNSATVGIFRLK